MSIFHMPNPIRWHRHKRSAHQTHTRIQQQRHNSMFELSTLADHTHTHSVIPFPYPLNKERLISNWFFLSLSCSMFVSLFRKQILNQYKIDVSVWVYVFGVHKNNQIVCGAIYVELDIYHLTIVFHFGIWINYYCIHWDKQTNKKV